MFGCDVVSVGNCGPDGQQKTEMNGLDQISMKTKIDATEYNALLLIVLLQTISFAMIHFLNDLNINQCILLSMLSEYNYEVEYYYYCIATSDSNVIFK